MLTKAHTGFFFPWILFLSGRFMVKISTFAFWCISCQSLCKAHGESQGHFPSVCAFQQHFWKAWFFPVTFVKIHWWCMCGPISRLLPWLLSISPCSFIDFLLLCSSKLCYLIHRHLRLLYLLYKFTPLSLWNDFIHGDVLCLKCVLSDIEVATLALFNYF